MSVTALQDKLPGDHRDVPEQDLDNFYPAKRLDLLCK